MTPQPQVEHPLPRWVGATTFFGVLAVLVGGAAYWGWDRFSQPAASELTEVGPAQLPIVAAVRGGRGAATQPAPARVATFGIVQRSPTNYQVRTFDATMTATKGPNDKEWRIRLDYARAGAIPPDDQAAILARIRLASDAAYAKSLQVNADQVKQLKALPAAPSLSAATLSPPDQARLKTLWEQYSATPTPAGASALMDAVRDVGASSSATTRKSVVEFVQKVRAILTPEQIAAFRPAATG